MALAKGLDMTVSKLDVVRLTADFVLLPEDTIFDEVFRKSRTHTSESR